MCVCFAFYSGRGWSGSFLSPLRSSDPQPTTTYSRSPTVVLTILLRQYLAMVQPEEATATSMSWLKDVISALSVDDAIRIEELINNIPTGMLRAGQGDKEQRKKAALSTRIQMVGRNSAAVYCFGNINGRCV